MSLRSRQGHSFAHVKNWFNHRVNSALTQCAMRGITTFSLDDGSQDAESKGREILRNCVKLSGADDPGWDKIRILLEKIEERDEGNAALGERYGRFNVTVFHIVCTRKPPADVVSSMLRICPKSAKRCDEEGNLALHYACGTGAADEVIQILVDAFPECLYLQGTFDNTPLHTLFYQERLPSIPTLKALSTPKIINMRNVDGIKPFDLFVKQIKRLHYQNSTRDILYDPTPPERILTLLLDAKPLGNTKFLRSIKSLPPQLHEKALVHPHVQKVLKHRVADRFPVFILIVRFYVNTLTIISFTSAVTSFNFTDRQVDDSKSVAWELVGLRICIAYLIFAVSMRFLATIFMNRLGLWLRTIWNWIDILDIFLLVSSVHVLTGKDFFRGYRFAGEEYLSDMWNVDGTRVLLMITGGMVWMRMLIFLKSIHLPFSMFVAGAIRVTKTLIPFMITSAIVLSAFALMYHIDIKNTPECEAQVDADDGSLTFCTLNGSFLKIYAVFINGEIHESDYIRQNTTMWLTIVFAFIVIILLLNVLIAIIVDCYNNAVISGRKHYWEYRFQCVLELEFIKAFFSSFFVRLNGCRHLDDEVPDRPKEKRRDWRLWHKCRENLCRDTENEEDDDGSQVQMPRCRSIFHTCCLSISKVWTLLFMGIWVLVGFLSFGLLWPPQVRKWLSSREDRALYEEKELIDRILPEVKRLLNDTTKEMHRDIRGELARIKDQQHLSNVALAKILMQLDKKMETIDQYMIMNSPSNVEVSLYDTGFS